MTMKCLVCGVEIEDNWPRVMTKKGPLCMGCEFSSLIVVEIRGNFGVYVTRVSDHDDFLSFLAEELRCMDDGDFFTVKKREMQAAEYFSLGEFQGT